MYSRGVSLHKPLPLSLLPLLGIFLGWQSIRQRKPPAGKRSDPPAKINFRGTGLLCLLSRSSLISSTTLTWVKLILWWVKKICSQTPPELVCRCGTESDRRPDQGRWESQAALKTLSQTCALLGAPPSYLPVSLNGVPHRRQHSPILLSIVIFRDCVFTEATKLKRGPLGELS